MSRDRRVTGSSSLTLLVGLSSIANQVRHASISRDLEQMPARQKTTRESHSVDETFFGAGRDSSNALHVIALDTDCPNPFSPVRALSALASRHLEDAIRHCSPVSLPP
jgi:hypothetical protein